ncbi:MAG: hypothetical protein AAGA99_26525 [Actinomycetota bacterium]
MSGDRTFWRVVREEASDLFPNEREEWAKFVGFTLALLVPSVAVVALIWAVDYVVGAVL